MVTIFSHRFHRNGHAIRPDPTVDRIMAAVANDDEAKLEETTGLVTLMIPSDDGPTGSLPIDIGLNGVTYRMYRDQVVTLPREIAEILISASEQRSLLPSADGKGKIVTQYDPVSGQTTNLSEVVSRRWRVQIERME